MLFDARLETLLEALTDPDEVRRAEAARLLVNRKESPELVLPQLLARADDPEWMVRFQLPRAAVYLGMLPTDAIPFLRRMFAEDEQEIVRSMAAWALRQFGETEGLPPVDDSPPELVVYGAIPDLRGRTCEEFLVQELWYGDELADGVAAVWMRFASQWYRLRFDCIVYWEAEVSGPEEEWQRPDSVFTSRLVDLAGEMSLRGVAVEELVAEARLGDALVRFAFANGVVLEFEDHLDETVYRRSRRYS
jgi:hypothetical protein